MRHQVAITRALVAACAAMGMTLLAAAPALAHCDGLDGPVVKAAQEALAKGDVNLVLIWVSANDEAEIRRAFDRTLNVRTLSAQARELADTYFFETLVRVHRAGEGAPFTGLKPAGRDLGPAIPAADRALASGDVSSLTQLMVDAVRHGLLERYQQTMAAGRFSRADVEAGREYVERYVAFIHYAEALYEAATDPVTHHYTEDSRQRK